MKYPVISLDACRERWQRYLAGDHSDLELPTAWVGDGDELDLSAFSVIAAELRDELDGFETSERAANKDAFEGQAAGRVHSALAHVPIAALDDPGFWRYLTLAEMPWLAKWRESGTFEKEWVEYKKYVDGTSHSEGVLPRMYLRGRLSLVGEDDYSLSSVVERATDLWRSHIVRVRTSYSTTLTQGLVRQVADLRMNTDDLRAHAKRLNRLSSNVVLQIYDEDEVAEVLDELYDA